MECKSSKFMLGLAIGAVVGVLAQRFSSSPKGKQLRYEAHCKLHKMRGKAENALTAAKDKIAEMRHDMSGKYPQKMANVSGDM